MNNQPITNFGGEHHWLSNFHVADVMFEGIMYRSTEHAFQAAKSLDPEERDVVRRAATSGMAKRAGGRNGFVTLRSDWEQIKVEVMTVVVRDKFTRHPELRAQLLATGECHLLEGNNWHDNCWGNCDCGKYPECSYPGKNELGKILMKVRAELQAETCSVCGTTENVANDHAGWGLICESCFKLPPEVIERGQSDN